LGIDPLPALLADSDHTPPTTVVRRVNEAGEGRSIKGDDSEVHDEHPGEDEDEDEDEGIKGDAEIEGESGDEDGDSSDSDAISIEASSTSPRPSTSPNTSPLGPISDILASVWAHEST